MSDLKSRAKEIFLKALNQTGNLESFVADACRGDKALQQRVEALLDAHHAAGEFLLPSNLDATFDSGGPAPDEMTRSLPAAEPKPSSQIGPYKLLEEIGEGGMGTVWVAQQSKPIKRKVAIKLIKAGMDSQQVLARFEAERQALAMMDHPNISRVVDAGMTEQGRPYFAMEYVKGVPLTEYCNEAKLSVKDRLELFLPICNAVQHAHQKGIIHRDLKPSNILICLYDGKPVPKVIDFGLAKAMHQSLTDRTLHTSHGMMVGTPLYMSPEQADSNNLDIDTRTDVYSLGVILYELLTGSTPLEKAQFKQAAMNEILRLIKEVEAPKPSTRLSGSASLPSIAAQRSIDPRQLSKSLAGELDWIVMKSLEKERSRRYETANGLARDVERFLNDEAVEACPPSTAYRLRKFIHRNRPQVIAASLVLLALVGGIVGTSVGLYQANVARAGEAEQRKLAEARELEANDERVKAEASAAEALRQEALAKEQEAEAKKQAAIAEAVAKFQTDMLAAVDPSQLPVDPVTGEPLKDALTVVQAMAAAVKVLDEGNLQDQPLVEARVRETIGNTFHGLGRYADGESNQRKSLALRRAALPAGHLDIAIGLNNLAMLLQAQDKLAEAEPLYREALEIRRAALPAGHRDIAGSLNNLASLLTAQNKLAEAEALYREALAIWRAALPVGHPEIAKGLNNLASLLQVQNMPAEAEPLLREALESFRAALPAGHPIIATGLNNLAGLLRYQNRLADAEPLLREALEIRRASFPAGSPDIAQSLSNLGTLLQDQHKLAEAEPLLREALVILRASLPAGHPDIATGLGNLASLLQVQDKLAEAEPLFREALEIRRASLPAGHPDIANGLNSLASLYWRQGKFDQSIPMFEEALKALEAARGRQHPQTINTIANLGVNYRDAGRLARDIKGVKYRIGGLSNVGLRNLSIPY